MDSWTRQDFLTLQTWFGDCTEGLGDLLRHTSGPDDLWTATADPPPSLSPRVAGILHQVRRQWPRRNPAARDLSALREGCDFLPLTDPDYPPSLRSVPDPPPWLFCRGRRHCLRKPAIAIVGSRRASRAGLQAAGELAQRLAGAGYTVCSGLALGIDGAAHRGALRGGSTVAVLASGVDCPSPRRNLGLASQILETGCLLSELPPGTAPDRYRFPRRNRIISGMAATTIIVEAALPSGTMHTAAAALEQGREVMVLPWSVYHPGGAGCLRLLRDGATPITSLEDLESLFPGLGATPGNKRRLPPGDRGAVLACIGDGALSADDLQQMMDLELSKLLVLLAELELEGWLLRDGGRYRRRSARTL